MRVSEKQKSKTGNQKTNIAKQYVRDCDQLFIVSRYERNAEIRVVFVYELPARQNKTKKNRNKKKKMFDQPVVDGAENGTGQEPRRRAHVYRIGNRSSFIVSRGGYL